MHDLDRQQLEQYEQEGLVGEYAIGELTEAQEMELAAQFLEVASEEELEQFLGDLYDRAKAAAGDAYAAAGRAYNSDLVQNQVIPALKKAARTYGPGLAGKAAERVLGPGSGTWVQSGAQWAADRWLKEELEGLSGEDREFEVARRYIRFAIDALQRALQAPPRVPQPVAAQITVGEAARTHAPGLVPFVPELVGVAAPRGRVSNGRAGSGRWVRRGSSVVIDLG
jgi:hypothetical protein